MRPLIEKFVRSFQKAISAEMEAMRRRLGPFEAPVANGRRLDGGDDRTRVYAFDLLQPNDKLVLHGECTLAYEGGEELVTIEGLDGEHVTLSCAHDVPMSCNAYALVIYPWFLYEKLKLALEELQLADSYNEESALRLFGKHPANVKEGALSGACPGLNGSQRRAVQLCVGSDLAFVWGPPGTGKTTTLASIVTELLGCGHRILVTSTTNAAVDQALAKLHGSVEAAEAFERGQVVRVGQAHGATFGASLPEVSVKLNGRLQARLERLKARSAAAAQEAERCGEILEKLREGAAPVQGDLFAAAPDESVTLRELTGVFSSRHARYVLGLPAGERIEHVARRQRRLARVCELCAEGIRDCANELRGREQAVVRQARVVLATMTNVYISGLLKDERFDVVIVEEAGMAILPTLFYCATLAGQKVIAVGDPRQLPPIVQSSDRYVYQAMGRSIFEITAPSPHDCDAVVMLDTQYRMHPVIGRLVSEMFYDGMLRNGDGMESRQAIADRRPCPGAPLVVWDTNGQTQCEAAEGSYSRFNMASAQLCVGLAAEAARDGIGSIAIITPYAEQSRLIRHLLKQARLGKADVECRTVHRFQGNERELVILDTVDTSPFKPGVLLAGSGLGSAARNLLNVSVSRARGKLVAVADVAYFESRAGGSAIAGLLGRAVAAGTLRRVEARDDAQALSGEKPR